MLFDFAKRKTSWFSNRFPSFFFALGYLGVRVTMIGAVQVVEGNVCRLLTRTPPNGMCTSFDVVCHGSHVSVVGRRGATAKATSASTMANPPQRTTTAHHFYNDTVRLSDVFASLVKPLVQQVSRQRAQQATLVLHAGFVAKTAWFNSEGALKFIVNSCLEEARVVDCFVGVATADEDAAGGCVLVDALGMKSASFATLPLAGGSHRAPPLNRKGAAASALRVSVDTNGASTRVEGLSLLDATEPSALDVVQSLIAPEKLQIICFHVVHSLEDGIRTATRHIYVVSLPAGIPPSDGKNPPSAISHFWSSLSGVLSAIESQQPSGPYSRSPVTQLLRPALTRSQPSCWVVALQPHGPSLRPEVLEPFRVAAEMTAALARIMTACALNPHHARGGPAPRQGQRTQTTASSSAVGGAFGGESPSIDFAHQLAVRSASCDIDISPRSTSAEPAPAESDWLAFVPTSRAAPAPSGVNNDSTSDGGGGVAAADNDDDDDHTSADSDDDDIGNDQRFAPTSHSPDREPPARGRQTTAALSSSGPGLEEEERNALQARHKGQVDTLNAKIADLSTTVEGQRNTLATEKARCAALEQQLASERAAAINEAEVMKAALSQAQRSYEQHAAGLVQKLQSLQARLHLCEKERDAAQAATMRQTSPARRAHARGDPPVSPPPPAPAAASSSSSAVTTVTQEYQHFRKATEGTLLRLRADAESKSLRIDELLRQHRAKDKALKSVQAELAMQQRELDHLTGVLRSQQSGERRQQTDLAEELLVLKQKLDVADEQIMQRDNELDDLRDQVSNQASKLDAAEVELDVGRQALAMQARGAGGKVSHARTGASFSKHVGVDTKALEAIVRLKEGEEMRQARDEMAALRSHAAELQAQVSAAEDEAAERNATMGQRLEIAQEDASRSKEAERTLLKERDRLQAQCANLTSRLKEAERDYVALQAANASLLEELSTTNDTVRQLMTGGHHHHTESDRSDVRPAAAPLPPPAPVATVDMGVGRSRSNSVNGHQTQQQAMSETKSRSPALLGMDAAVQVASSRLSANSRTNVHERRAALLGAAGLLSEGDAAAPSSVGKHVAASNVVPASPPPQASWSLYATGAPPAPGRLADPPTGQPPLWATSQPLFGPVAAAASRAAPSVPLAAATPTQGVVRGSAVAQVPTGGTSARRSHTPSSDADDGGESQALFGITARDRQMLELTLDRHRV